MIQSFRRGLSLGRIHSDRVCQGRSSTEVAGAFGEAKPLSRNASRQ
jgi:hypothetical protein